MVASLPLSVRVSPPVTMPPIQGVGSTINTDAPSRAAVMPAAMPDGVPP